MKIKIKTKVSAGGIWDRNHNQALKLKTRVKAGAERGGWDRNHSQGLKVKTRVKAGITGDAKTIVGG